MRWDQGHESDDVEDLRGETGGGGSPLGFGGGGGMRVGFGGLLVLGILSLVFKTDLLSPFLGGGNLAPVTSSRAPRPSTAAEESLKSFSSFVLDDAQNTWTKILPEQQGVSYRRAKMVLFRDAVRSGCGDAEAAMGPFYCPADEKVYLDLNFFDELKRKFGAPGDFAEAYVIAHEIGHHVQNILGIERKLRIAQQQNPRAQKQLSVLMELQADCFAGIWANSTGQRNLLEAGDINEALGAASAVGDDHIQQMSGSRVRPESFTHGTSAQRQQWFKTGYETGKVTACNTFATN
ncbi:neutral zinc metallopeptidase [Bryobacter aggregatus]|uniref:KPN_02809 family neutral zinc metallopeptidase n=1 Tax=Bryobacter aggregatus TaxID=360054 RepID=UPI0004E10581|nr:neutral zinc metallopeptidase [Bryobacter aggregatus]